MGMLKCYQCGQSFADSKPFCPHCGAMRKETGSGKAVRLVRRGFSGFVIGILVALPTSLIVALVFSLAVGEGEDMVQVMKIMGAIGIVCGGPIAAIYYVFKELNKED